MKNNFQQIFHGLGVTTINTDHIMTTEMASFKSDLGYNYHLKVEMSNGKMKTFSFEAAEYGNDAEELAYNAQEALTGINELA